MGIFGTPPMAEPADGIASNGLRRESVWDYPRPPRIEPVNRHVRVALNEVAVAASDRGQRVLETAGAPVVYLPRDDILEAALIPASGSTSLCEWKGLATYFDVHGGERVAERAAWAYLEPNPPFAAIAGHVAFYPGLLECRLDDERVEPQPGRFYGGWVTAEICGPIKGVPGSSNW